jgi:hypothetical protein
LRALVFAAGTTLVALALSRPTLAYADDGKMRVAFHWTRADGAESCIDEAALAARIDGVLGRTTFVERADAEAVVHARVERGSKGWIAHIGLSDRDGKVLGTRDLDSDAPDCRAFDDALSLVIALAVDTLVPTKAEVLHAPPLASPSPPWRSEVSVVGLGSYGLLPGTAGGLGFAAAIQPPHFWPIELNARFWFPSSASLDGTSGAAFTAWQIGLRLCAPIIRKIVEPRICGGASLGRLTGEGFGLPLTASPSSWLVDLSLEAVPVIHLGDRVALEPGLGVEVPLVRDRFYYTVGDDPTRRVLHQPAPAVFLFDLGFAVTIP